MKFFNLFIHHKFPKYFTISIFLSFLPIHSSEINSWQLREKSLLLTNGYIAPLTKTRGGEAIDENVENSTKKSGLDLFISGTSVFGSQRGGVEKEGINKYAGIGTISPGIFIWARPELFGKCLELYNITALEGRYTEQYKEEKTRQTRIDGELILSAYCKGNRFHAGLEAGRGFHRLDNFGFFYSGKLNFTDLFFRLNQFPLKIGFLYSSFSYMDPVLTYENFVKSNRLYGLYFQTGNFSYFPETRIFYYQITEPYSLRYIGHGGFDNPEYNPYGKFHTLGLELSYPSIWKTFTLHAGGINTKGFRENYPEKWSTSQFSTELTGGIFYGFIKYKPESFSIYSGGGSITHKNYRNIDSYSTGWNGLKPEPGLFGGRSSFLLMEDRKQGENRIVPDIGDEEKPSYRNKGKDIFHLGFGWEYKNFLFFDLMGNFARLPDGSGKEGILRFGIYKKKKDMEAFFLISACLAYIKSNERETVILEEITRESKSREYQRYYLSGGIRF